VQVLSDFSVIISAGISYLFAETILL